LLIGCLLLVALGFLMVLGAGLAAGQRLDRLDLLPLLIYAASLAVIHPTLVLSRFRGDQRLPVAFAFLSGIELLAQYRMGAFAGAGPWAITRLLLPVGVLVMLAVCIAGRAGSSFGMLLGLGLTTVIATQTFLNIGSVTKFIPLTGITLLFISQGAAACSPPAWA